MIDDFSFAKKMKNIKYIETNLTECELLEQIKYIQTNLTERELLEQLDIKEAAELGKAALKVIRAKELNNNPTPVDIDTAAANLLEEMKDVYLVFWLLYGWTPIKELDIESNPKLRRWAERIKEAKAARAKEGGKENAIE